MDAQGTEGFLAALLFGAVSVWFHAINQFNRSTYDQSTEFYRLLTKLRPSDLREGNVYRQAFLFYAAILTLIYLAICMLLTVPGLQQFSELVPGLSALGGAVGAEELPRPSYVAGVAFDETGGFEKLGGVDSASGLNPSIPLAVSLAVVGLAPNVPMLYRFEEFVRETAHRLSGIPTHLVTGALALRHTSLIPADPGMGSGLQKSDLERLDSYTATVDQKIDNAERFVADVTKIIILRRWILEQELFAPYLPISTKYRLAEIEVRERVTALMRDLDRISGYAALDPGQPGAVSASPRMQRDWSALITETEETVEDLCLLVVLYQEHNALQIASMAPGEGGKGAEKLRLAKRFTESMAEVMEQANIENVSSGLFSRLSLSILVVAFISAAVIGWIVQVPQLEMGSRAAGLAKFMATLVASAAVTYIPALFFTLTLQQSSYVSVPPVWENAFSDGAKRSRYIPQLLGCFFVAVLLAFFFRLGYHFYFVANTVGIDLFRERLWQVLDYAVSLELLFALNGGVVAVTVILIIDAWRAGRLKPTRWAVYLLLPALLFYITALGWRMQGKVYGRQALLENWTTALELLVIPPLIGLVVSIYATVFLRDEFPKVYEAGVAQNS